MGWHAEGPFLQTLKRGAHSQPFLLPAPAGFSSIEEVYGSDNLLTKEDWDIRSAVGLEGVGVRMITLAPEIDGVMDAIPELGERGVVVSIGHSIASSDVATRAVRRGSRLITHLFNAMPQLHHRDPGIIGLLGASPASLVSNHSPTSSIAGYTQVISPINTSISAKAFSGTLSRSGSTNKRKPTIQGSEALDEHETPPQTPIFHALPSRKLSRADLLQPSRFSLDAPLTTDPEDDDDKKAIHEERPFYGMIVDGVHSHPNSVRVS